MNEIEFIRKLLLNHNEIELKNIYSQSSHKRKALSDLNCILHEHPEYYPTICVLASHNIQVWASDQRRHLHINFDGLTKNILMFDHLSEEEIEDSLERLKAQAHTLKKTESAMRHLEKIIDQNTLDGKVLAAIHLDAEDISKYIFSNHYYNAVIRFCEEHNDEFKNLLSGKMLEHYINGDNDSDFAYHNGPALIRLLPKLVRKHILPDELTKTIYLCIEQCLLRIETAEDGESMYEVLEYFVNGMSEVKISKTIGRSRNYVRSKLAHGTELLSYIIWGYGTRAIMSNLTKIDI